MLSAKRGSGDIPEALLLSVAKFEGGLTVAWRSFMVWKSCLRLSKTLSSVWIKILNFWPDLVFLSFICLKRDWKLHYGYTWFNIDDQELPSLLCRLWFADCCCNKLRFCSISNMCRDLHLEGKTYKEIFKNSREWFVLTFQNNINWIGLKQHYWQNCFAILLVVTLVHHTQKKHGRYHLML